MDDKEFYKMKRRARPKKKNDEKIYLSNKVFLAELIKWKEAKKRDPDVQMSDELGLMFQTLIDRIASRPNFSGYTYLDEMKSEAIYVCINYANNFNPEKSQNPFAYFTTLIFNAFRKVLKKEQKNRDIKQNLIDSFYSDLVDDKDHKVDRKEVKK